MNQVAILGCGPAGLMVAHAVKLCGGNPVIISRRVKSELPGAQYLHRAIPMFCGPPDGIIRTVRTGTAEGYAQKVYGDPSHPTSWNTAQEQTPAWDLRRVYRDLWGTYNYHIVDREIGRGDLDKIEEQFPLVISTVPAQLLCTKFDSLRADMVNGVPVPHEFRWEKMYVVDWAPPELLDNTVLYSGDSAQEWYRSARVFGHVSSEATQYSLQEPAGYAEPEAKVFPLKTGLKVKGNDCDCRPEIKRAGRYGTWRKGYLTHHAFEDALYMYKERFG